MSKKGELLEIADDLYSMRDFFGMLETDGYPHNLFEDAARKHINSIDRILEYALKQQTIDKLED